jgi:uncharacterized membrane protein YuzA (DUF378 family)
LLGVESPVARVNFVIIGLLAAGLALYEVREVRRNPRLRSME